MNKKIDTILWDIDATLLNFEASEAVSIRECFKQYDVTITDEQFEMYKKINRSYWDRFERNEISKQSVYRDRFVDLFAYLNVKGIDPDTFNDAYQMAIGTNYVLEEGAIEICETLSKNYRQYVVTNGSTVAQYTKLKGSTLDQYMDGIFISDEMGVAKPDKKFFDLCASQIKNYDPETTMIIGDSLTSDMQGGNNAGIRCCWFNPKQLPLHLDLRIDHQITKLKEVLDLL
ncbi:5'-nucleotidase YjjG [Lachnospiraceae bacterium KM106-2]|nr:5'-nucleotidase YjjG [Lachnospiraceae bacterium KM106-2]